MFTWIIIFLLSVSVMVLGWVIINFNDDVKALKNKCNDCPVNPIRWTDDEKTRNDDKGE